MQWNTVSRILRRMAALWAAKTSGARYRTTRSMAMLVSTRLATGWMIRSGNEDENENY